MSSLLEQILRGDDKAILKFYTLYSPQILKYLIANLPKKEDAEDLLNDVFLDALDGLPMFQEKSNIKTWLYKIAHNKIMDFYRKRKIKAVLFSQAPFLETLANEIAQPEFQFEKDKIRDRIEKAFLSISSQYQKILQLHYEDKIPVKELAVIFNLSFKATESMLFRARRRFRQAYERA